MPVDMFGILEDVKTYTGKNGFGANITMSILVEKRRKSITFNSNNAEIASKCENHLQENVCITIMLDQSNFGLRLGDVLNIDFDVQKTA